MKPEIRPWLDPQEQAEAADPAAALADKEGRHNPRIFIASHSDYEVGHLFGSWFNAVRDVDDLEGCVERLVKDSPIAGADGYLIYDYEDFAGLTLGQHETIETVVQVARGLWEHGNAFAAWAKVVGLEQATITEYKAHYLGSWRSLAHYGEEFARDLGLDQFLSGVPPSLEKYVRLDHAALVRDMILDGEIVTEQDEEHLHVFLTPGTG